MNYRSELDCSSEVNKITEMKFVQLSTDNLIQN